MVLHIFLLIFFLLFYVKLFVLLKFDTTHLFSSVCIFINILLFYLCSWIESHLEQKHISHVKLFTSESVICLESTYFCILVILYSC